MSVESQSPTPEENGEKQQQIWTPDDLKVLETETVSVESEIAKVKPFPNNNAIFSCHSITPSGDRSISPSQPEVEKSEGVDSFGELDRVRIISDEETYLRYTGQISLFSSLPAPLFISIQPDMILKAIVGLNITDVFNVSRDSPLLSRLCVFWQSLMQGMGWKGGGGAIARSQRVASLHEPLTMHSVTAYSENVRQNGSCMIRRQPPNIGEFGINTDRTALLTEMTSPSIKAKDQLISARKS